MAAKTKIFRINNFTGLMNTMSEENNFLGIDPNASLGVGATTIPFEMKNIENWMPSYRGGLSKTFGFTLLKYVGSSTPITGLYRYLKADGTSKLIVSYGNTVYSLAGGVLTSTTMTVTNGAYLDFQTAYDKLVVCDGAAKPQTYDSTTVADLAAGADATAVLGARQSCFYANRLFVFSATHDQSLLYYSDAGNIGTGYAANFIPCDVSDGQKITGIKQYFIPGQLEPVIIVSKERSIGVVTGDGTTGNPFTFNKITFDVGVYGFRQIQQFNQDVAFLTQKGITSYSAALKNINITESMLSRNIANQFTGLTQTYLKNALSWFDWKNRRVSFAVPTGSSQYPDTIWHYDIQLNGFYKQTGFNTTVAMVDTDGTVYTGDDKGNIYQHGSSYQSYNGNNIISTLQTPYLDFFDPYHFKRVKQAKITVRGNGQYSLGVSTQKNYGKSLGTVNTIPLSAGEYIWNGGVWTSDPSIYQWGGNPLLVKKFFPGGLFENMSFTFSHSGTAQTLDLLELVLDIEYLGIT